MNPQLSHSSDPDLENSPNRSIPGASLVLIIAGMLGASAAVSGLNRNRQPALKAIFKGAALTVADRMPSHPLRKDYQALLERGLKPSLARVTIARRIASATLALWKKKEDYDPAKHRPKNAA